MGKHARPPLIPEEAKGERLYSVTRKENGFLLKRQEIGRVVLATDDGAVYGFYTDDDKVGMFSIGGHNLGRHRGAPEQYTLPSGEQGAVLTPVGANADVTGYQLFHRECAGNVVSVTKEDDTQIGRLMSYVFANEVGIVLESVGATLYEPILPASAEAQATTPTSYAQAV
jgi:hypothetical protein